MEHEVVLFEKRGSIAIITLNRPKSLNALNDELVSSLSEMLTKAAKDESVRVLVLSGAGNGFCAGGDLAHLESLKTPPERKGFIQRVGRVAKQIIEMPKPVIAMVNGVAAGAGCNLMLACDLIVAAHSARFAQSFAKVGLIPDCAGLFLLPRAVGRAWAKEMMFTGELLSATQASAIGLVNHVVEVEYLESETIQLAEKLAQSPPLALALTKQMLNHSDASLDDVLNFEALAQPFCMETTDHQEGIAAFRQKRDPVFTGR